MTDHHVKTLTAFAWGIGTVLAFCLQAIATRELDKAIPVQEIVLFRALTGLVVTVGIITWIGNHDLFKTRRPGMHLIRHGFHFFGQCGWLFGIGYLALADVFALEFTVPVWVALIAAIFLRERLTVRRCIAIALGLVGVVIIVNPTTGLIEGPALIVLASAVFYAIAFTANKSLAHTDSAMTLIFFMSLIQFPMGLVLSIHAWVTPQGQEWFWLIAIGLCALAGHYCITRAMQLADVSFVMTVDYLRLPLIAVIGSLLYLEPLKYPLLIGGLIILIGNMINVRDQLDRATVHDKVSDPGSPKDHEPDQR